MASTYSMADDIIPFPCLNAWVRAASLCRLNVNPLLMDAGLQADQHGAHHISRAGLINAMMQSVYQTAPEHHFPLLVGQSFAFDTVPAIETYLATSPTLRDALAALHWVSQLHTDIRLYTEEGPQGFAIIVEVVAQPDDPPKAAGYFVVMNLACLAKFSRMLMGDQPLVTRIDLEHDPGPVRALCEAQFGSPIVVGQPRNAVWIRPSLLDVRLPGSVPGLHKQLHQVIEQTLPVAPGKRLAAQIEYHFRRDPGLMGQGIQQMAELMKLHPRTLQRRLKEEGEVFGDIQTRCRYELAVLRLKGGQVDIDSLSEELGFTDRNSFTRAFKIWTGLAPRAFRKLSLAPASQAVAA
ncbi:MAG: AraC family transcriptional regulator [Aquabacterium sp.]|nr:MAG: AraC family transcriptional regulator [Aquabacterium sp.]